MRERERERGRKGWREEELFGHEHHRAVRRHRHLPVQFSI